MVVKPRRVEPHEPDYPSRLKALGDPPPLYTLGPEKLLNPKQALAVVGSRQATEEALKLAREAGRYFAGEGYVVVSGLARGVDLEATLGALEKGWAVAAVPYGLASHEARRVLRRVGEYVDESLLLVSELDPKASWQARFAMMRNRLVVGLADALLVVQTGLKVSERQGRKVKSGTWDAAEKAQKMGRPVFVLNLPLEGNQALIREGWAIPLLPGKDGFFALEEALHKKERSLIPRKERARGEVEQPLLLDEAAPRRPGP